MTYLYIYLSMCMRVRVRFGGLFLNFFSVFLWNYPVEFLLTAFTFSNLKVQLNFQSRKEIKSGGYYTFTIWQILHFLKKNFRIHTAYRWWEPFICMYACIILTMRMGLRFCVFVFTSEVWKSGKFVFLSMFAGAGVNL